MATFQGFGIGAWNRVATFQGLGIGAWNRVATFQGLGIGWPHFRGLE